MTASKKPRIIFGSLFLLGVTAVSMIIGSVYWLTGRIDQLERESTESIVELMVTEKVSQVGASTADYAHWSLAYELVKSNDEESLNDNIGTGAAEGYLFDQIVILDASGQVLHNYTKDGAVTQLDQFDLGSIQPFVSKLRETAPADHEIISGIGQVNGIYGAVAAGFITPDYVSTLKGEPLPIMLGIKFFTHDVLGAIARLTQGTGYAIKPINDGAQKPAIGLAGPDGTPVAQLVWTHKQVGTILRTEVMPGILLVCLGIFGTCLLAARYFHLQSKALERAVIVASTDRLTGLLNRSGLDELLREPETRARIDAGQAAVLYLDLNDFKILNDEHGHQAGDHALKTTAERLKASVRPQDHVVRLGGDEFICVVLDEAPGAAAKSVSDRVLISCNTPIAFADFEKILGPSLGVAVGKPGIAWATLLARADEAMYQAKRHKQTVAVFFEDPKESGVKTASGAKAIAA